MAYILTVDFVSVNGAVSYEKRWYEPTAYIIGGAKSGQEAIWNENQQSPIACQKKGVSRQELNDLCPREYYYDFLTWLCMQANAVAVWNNDCCYGLSINRKQIGTLRKLKMAGVYGGTIPKI